MPVSIHKKDGYQVRTPGGVKAKNTSARRALAQKRLLLAVEHGWKPTGAKGRPVSGESIRKLAMSRRQARLSKKA